MAEPFTVKVGAATYRYLGGGKFDQNLVMLAPEDYERLKRAEDDNEHLRDLLRRAHDAMMDWHFAHGAPDGFMNQEERQMGAMCREIYAALEDQP